LHHLSAREQLSPFGALRSLTGPGSVSLPVAGSWRPDHALDQTSSDAVDRPYFVSVARVAIEFADPKADGTNLPYYLH
jgi:hypothetical protein